MTTLTGYYLDVYQRMILSWISVMQYATWGLVGVVILTLGYKAWRLSSK